MTEPIELPLTDITILSDLQPRVAGLDDDHVRTLEESVAAWPRLGVVDQDGKFVLVDGFHRYAAAQHLGLESVPVEVLEPPADGDLRGLAFARNAVHGRPLSLTDRRAEAKRLLLAEADFADRELARRCGLSDKTVGAIRADLERTAEIPQLERRVGADRKTRSVAPTAKTTRSAATRASNGTTDEAREPGRKGKRASAAEGLAPSFAAVLDVVDRMRNYTDDHAPDGLADAIATAVTDQRDRPEWSEIAGVLETWGAAFIGACDALRKRLNDEGANPSSVDASAVISADRLPAAPAIAP